MLPLEREPDRGVPAPSLDSLAVAILGVDVGGTFTDAVLLDDGELRTAKVPTAARQEESVLAAAPAVGAAERRALHARHDGGHERAARAQGRADGVRRDRGLRAPAPPAAAGPRAPLPAVRGAPGAARPARALPRRARADRARRRARAARARLAAGARRRRRSPSACSSRSATPSHERAVAEELRRRLPGAHVVASHEVSPEFREYERASTTAVDAYLGPLVARLPARRSAARAAGAGCRSRS